MNGVKGNVLVFVLVIGFFVCVFRRDRNVEIGLYLGESCNKRFFGYVKFEILRLC